MNKRLGFAYLPLLQLSSSSSVLRFRPRYEVLIDKAAKSELMAKSRDGVGTYRIPFARSSTISSEIDCSEPMMSVSFLMIIESYELFVTAL